MKGRKNGDPPYTNDQFVAEIGHEFGNVIHGLLGMARLVRDSGLNPEQDRWLKAIEQSGQQLCRLLDAFRQGTVRSGADNGPFLAELDGIDLLEHLLLAHAPAARARANRLWITVAPELPRRWVSDACLLRQLLDNLLGNALKFTHSGEVVLEAAARPAGAGNRDTLVLSVTDTGPGVRPDMGNRIFQAYERGPPRQDDCAGDGLGLYICRRIARALGGRIEWSTPAGCGARFTVTLPGALPAMAARPASHPSRILRSVECRLELQGAARRSVASCLSRLGVAYGEPKNEAGRVAELAQAARCPGKESAQLLIAIAEVPSEPVASGVQLVLRAETPDGRALGIKRLGLPALECSLGPLLLELALECLWFRNAGSGSFP
jgi:hypothetical protein